MVEPLAVALPMSFIDELFEYKCIYRFISSSIDSTQKRDREREKTKRIRVFFSCCCYCCEI